LITFQYDALVYIDTWTNQSLLRQCAETSLMLGYIL